MQEELSMARSRGKVVSGEKDVNTKFTSSGTLFKRLQAEAQESIHGKSDAQTKESGKPAKPKSSALKL